jgi:hypothetical protein
VRDPQHTLLIRTHADGTRTSPLCATYILYKSEKDLNDPDRFSKIVINGTPEAQEWTAVRQTKYYQANFGVMSVSSADMRCFQNKSRIFTATIAAGETLVFVVSPMVTYFGPLQFYRANVPNSANIHI